MSTTKIKYQNVNKNGKLDESLAYLLEDAKKEGNDIDNMEKLFQQDPNIFLLNNLLMSVQFFENYERDVHLLREHWFKEISLESHHKKCFYADSLFRLAGANVTFAPQHGRRKNSETSLHPLRIYVSSDNFEAAFDPSALGRNRRNVWPQYQFTVKTNEKNEKSGCVQLVEYKARETSTAGVKATATAKSDFITFEKTEDHQNYLNFRRKSNSDPKNARRFTRTEKFIGSQNKEMTERRSSLRGFADITINMTISSDAFYKFTEPESRLKPTTIHNFRMNSTPLNSHEIPQLCFQRQDIKLTSQTRRRTGIMKNGSSPLFRSQTILNSAAFKGYFCDLLLERLAGALALDVTAVNKSSVLEEFIVINQWGMQCSIAPVIPIRDWNRFIVINKRLKGKEKKRELKWPSGYMHKIMNILPCNAVPGGHSLVSDENPDYEKEWKLVFPKAEEFLLLHMMHAHIRCYFFTLLIYKSFIETEINVASFGPKHLLHLLFWRVRKNFLAWPEDRPGETLLIYLKTLYKKLQNKYLSDFFITSRNLFATSFHKDLHKAQTIIKKILENPVPFIIRAVRNLKLKPDFYPVLDISKLHTVLTTVNVPEKSKQVKKEKRPRQVHFEKDDEQRWKKNAMKQIELERKADEENTRKLSAESINVDESLDFDALDQEKCIQVLEIFLSHFLKMRSKSLEFKFSSQAVWYLSQAQKLFDLMAVKGENRNETKLLREKLRKLGESNLPLREEDAQDTKQKEEKKIKVPVYKSENASRNEVKNEATEDIGDVRIKLITKSQTNEELNNKSDDDSFDENELYETKL